MLEHPTEAPNGLLEGLSVVDGTERARDASQHFVELSWVAEGHPVTDELMGHGAAAADCGLVPTRENAAHHQSTLRSQQLAARIRRHRARESNRPAPDRSGVRPESACLRGVSATC